MASKTRNTGKSNLKPAKATWTPAMHEVFVDLCLQQTLEGNKPGTHFTKEGWRNIRESFHKTSGLRYERMQLKNHWDNMKKQWKVWCKLIGTSSMKWDPNTQNFSASEEDWANYLETNPEATPFRSKELLFANKLNTIFDGTAVTEETEPLARRRKHSDGSITFLKYMEEEPGSKRPDRKTENLCDAVESRSIVSFQSSPAKLNYSIGECIECLDGMEEIEQGSDIYLFALDIFLKKEYREIFLNLRKPSVRIAWLQRLQSVGPSSPLH